jgi:hypothetical protein
VDDEPGDLTVEEAENLRRSVAMLPANGPSWLSRETALRVLGQLVRLLSERRHGRETGTR